MSFWVVYLVVYKSKNWNILFFCHLEEFAKENIRYLEKSKERPLSLNPAKSFRKSNGRLRNLLSVMGGP